MLASTEHIGWIGEEGAGTARQQRIDERQLRADDFRTDASWRHERARTHAGFIGHTRYLLYDLLRVLLRQTSVTAPLFDAQAQSPLLPGIFA